MRYRGHTLVVEIKCPARCEFAPIVDKVTKKICVDFLDREAGKLVVKKSHSYYTQLQLQLYILNLSRAVFFVWSPKQTKKIFVNRDMSLLAKIVPKLEFFYFSFLLQELCETT